MKKLSKIIVLNENTIEAYERCTCVDYCRCDLMAEGIVNYDRNFVYMRYPSATFGGFGCT